MIRNRRVLGRRGALPLAAVVLGFSTSVGVASGPASAATTPLFTAKLASFHAIDESGVDWLGSDEVYAGMADLTGPSPSFAWTSTHDSVDSGDTKHIMASEQCIVTNAMVSDRNNDGFRQPRDGDTSWCTGVPIVKFNLALYDKESSFDWPCPDFNPNCICTRLGADDERLFESTYTYSGPTLMSLMPTIGAKHALTVKSQAKTNANYTAVIQLERVA